MTKPELLTPDDLMSPAVIGNPYPAYRQFRDQTPLRYVNLPGGVFPGLDAPLYA